MNGYEFYIILLVTILGISKRELLTRLILHEIDKKSDR